MSASASPSAPSSASDRLLRAAGRLSVSTATGPTFSRSSTASALVVRAALDVHLDLCGGFCALDSGIVSDLCRRASAAKGSAEGDGGDKTARDECRASWTAFWRPNFRRCSTRQAGFRSRRSGTAAAACGRPIRRNSSGPGGTISGPTMMALADFAMYVGVLASIGPVPLAVTINLNINFLRKPAARDLDRRMPAAQARQAAGGRGGDHPLRWHGRAGRACHFDLFDPGEMIEFSRWY